MKRVRWFLLACAILAIPAGAYAQEAVMNGTVTDSSGGVLPGVTITATNSATGNRFMAVTDGGGHYQLQVSPGTYKLSIELSGFTPVSKSGLTVLLGQSVTTNVPLAPGGVNETVTVTGEQQLVTTTSSTLGGNIDPKQVQELPTAGRNFMSLAMLAPGSRTSSTSATQPLPDRGRAGDVREFQISMDGQQVTRDMGTGTQPRYSNDMISEFQYIANRFDATMGRSSGIQMRIISKSGTNTFSGLGRVAYRSDKFNTEEPVIKKVLQINNLQMSTATGGPLVQNKIHWFGNLEYEREPTESVWTTPYAAFNISLTGQNHQHKMGGRIDMELTPSIRLMVKQSNNSLYTPFGPGTSNHPSSTNSNYEYNIESYARLTQVISNRAVNEIEGGRAVYGFVQASLVSWPQAWTAGAGVTTGSPRIRFTTFGFLPNQNLPRHQDQWVWNIKDNLSFSYDFKGRHDVRAGGEYMYRVQIQANRRFGTGEIDARGAAPPANIEALFPVWNDASTWRLDILCATPGLCRTNTIGVGDYNNWVQSHKVGAWWQDDWKLGDRLTLNLGLRWDADIGAYADINYPPWTQAYDYNQLTGFQPRLGFTYKVNEKTVIRGGGGLYIQGAISGDETNAKGNSQIGLLTYTNSPYRTDFAGNPTNGTPLPTYEQAQTQYCHVNNNAAGCVQLAALELVLAPKYEKQAHNWQYSIGVQRQLGSTVGFEVDYIFNHANNEKGIVDNINLTYDPATGVNNKFLANRASRYMPNWNYVSATVHLGRSTTQELRTSVTKRFAKNWQASGTYSLRYFWDAEPPPFSGPDPVPFATAVDLGNEWSLGAGDQRHRATFNLVWEVAKGFQVSMVQLMASGVRLSTLWGTDLRDINGNGGTERLRPDGTIIVRNNLVGPTNNRTDFRAQQKIPLGGRVKIDLIAEVFNLLNQPNYTVGVQENQPTQYNKPQSGEYRTAQLGARVSW
ncbi:MAG: TonB-dependent receptor [Acidobacteriota bacterium]